MNSFTTGLSTTMTLNGIATIENGNQTSAEIPNSGRAVVRLGFPTITSTTVTFEVQAYPLSGAVAAAEFRPLVDKDGNAVSYTIGSDKIVTIPELSGCAAFKFVMGSDEATTRSIEVTSRGDNPVVSPTEVDVTIDPGATIAVLPTTAATSNGYGTRRTITRPANQTPYAANDVVGGAIDLGVMGPAGSRIILTTSRFEPLLAEVPPGMTSFTLYLYSVTPPSALADNAPFVYGGAAGVDQASMLGAISLGSPVLPATSSTALLVETANIGKEVLLAGTNLFAYLVTAGAYTPAANSENYYLSLLSVGV